MSDVLQLLVVLIIVLVAAKGSGLVSSAVGQPAVLGELLAGVILGPSVIDLFNASFLDSPYLEESTQLLAQLGVIFLMFLAGLETDLGQVNKVRRVAFLAGSLGVIFTVVMGAGASVPFGFSAKESIFIGIILSATSVSISARTLMELGVLQGRQGLSILAAAVIDDVLGLLVLSFFIAFAVQGSSGGPTDAVLIVVRVTAFFAAAFIVGRLLLPSVMRWAMNAPMSEGALTAAIVVVLSYAWLAEYFGEVAAITGAFMAGLFLRQTDAHRLVDERARALAYGFFVPIFFVGVGLSANARELHGSDALLLIVICLVAAISKILGCGLGALLGGEPFKSALQIGTGMITRGEVGLIIATVGLSKGLIKTDVYSIIVLTVLATALATPLLLRIVFTQQKEARHA
ncbi:MAG: cation:proton antiporter [Chloroflexota bacterium]|nr:cation:proton antiporter [Chloroflexota bacterium]